MNWWLFIVISLVAVVLTLGTVRLRKQGSTYNGACHNLFEVIKFHGVSC